jgi:hypothetical protein
MILNDARAHEREAGPCAGARAVLPGQIVAYRQELENGAKRKTAVSDPIGK